MGNFWQLGHWTEEKVLREPLSRGLLGIVRVPQPVYFQALKRPRGAPLL